MPGGSELHGFRAEVSRCLPSSSKPTYLRNASYSSPQTLISGRAGVHFLSPLEGWPMAQGQSPSWPQRQKTVVQRGLEHGSGPSFHELEGRYSLHRAYPAQPWLRKESPPWTSSSKHWSSTLAMGLHHLGHFEKTLMSFNNDLKMMLILKCSAQNYLCQINYTSLFSFY